ncbi:hypothetical protein [uncultured Gammaproteobacteria bacterium]|jgi:hypothetical protein|nr:hypothetical protein BROOK1789C_2072 [Bathymodiolus brooksi thiotrophic gill symbiont]CAC9537349.1 hypothetical protein [uncultured Gammaproteobacteria bacterium]CAC9546364.1 hypothetical protein [uncultured Gammaproteobacteria bacterium]CAC9551353.1 hypothetical protein [uncultured Gammaproteobacteria bacterium]CAC9595777.1 hypothetical protein [uncultured Gammaproteobacteria bacterium]
MLDSDRRYIVRYVYNFIYFNVGESLQITLTSHTEL